jgi:hypothetical protein
MTVMQQDRIALDRAASVRTIDQDGHMHIADSAISKANVCGYRGSEIPDYEHLGLQPDKLYQLLRDPAELEKAADSFNGKPLLIEHKPQTAADHDRELTVGSVGNVRWEAPYLRGELAVWDASAIAGITSGEQKELSAAYRYVPVMEPGTYDGTRYDGRMTQIQANHVALVADGRAGSDVVVGDSQLGDIHMTTKLSRQALLASGALHAYIRPKLAKDVKLDLTPLLAGITGKTWKADKAKLKLAMDKAIVGKLAADADITDVVEMLDQLEEMADETTAVDEEAETDEERKARLAKRAADKAAKDEFPDKKDDDKKDDKKVAQDTTITKPAMDAAIADAITKANAANMANFAAIREAEKEVRPYIGELAEPQKDAAAVYRLALDSLGVDAKDVTEIAGLRLALKSQPLPGTEHRTPRLAQDAASEEAKFRKAYPGASRLIRT